LPKSPQGFEPNRAEGVSYHFPSRINGLPLKTIHRQSETPSPALGFLLADSGAGLVQNDVLVATLWLHGTPQRKNPAMVWIAGF
jgi:hypothetical protein